MPLAAYLGVPKTHVLANRMNWQWDDETGASPPCAHVSVQWVPVADDALMLRLRVVESVSLF